MDDAQLQKFKEDVSECMTLAIMAYMGNCGERQALRAIREKLILWHERGVLHIETRG